MEYLPANILVGVIILLFGIVVYFTKKTFDNTDTISKNVSDISRDVSEIKSKVEILMNKKF